MREPRDCLFFALDVEDHGTARGLARRLAGTVGSFKIGLQLFTAKGPLVVRTITDMGSQTFLDLKLHDIPETVRNAAKVAAAMGVDFMSVHAAGGPVMLAAAVKGAHEGNPDCRVLAVTVLTSMDLPALGAVGDEPASIGALVKKRALVAMEAGCAGVIASPQEAQALRELLGAEAFILTPGIRSADSPQDDQKRTATATQAIRAGASAIVVGRPIREAKNPVAAAQAFVDEIAAAQAG